MAEHIMKSLSRVIPKEHAWKVHLLESWPKLVGNLRGKVSLYKVDNSSIILSVLNPSWAHELSLLSEMLREKINHFLGGDYIKELRFRTRKYRSNKTNTQKKETTSLQEEQSSTVSTKPLIFTHTEKRALAALKSDDLRSALTEFYQTCKQRQHVTK